MENKEQIRIFGSILFKRGTAEVLKAKFGEGNCLAAGEPAYELDNKRIKIGDGSTPYAELDYVGDDGAKVQELENLLKAFLESENAGTEAIDTLTEILNSLKDTKDEMKEYANGLANDLDIRIDNLEAIKHDAYIDADEVLDEKIDANKLELNNKITAIQEAYSTADTNLSISISDEYNRATGIENGLNSRLAIVEEDYLKATDKAELNSSISNVSSVANEAKEAIDAFLKEADATENAVNTLKEIQAELDAGEASAANLLSEINALKAVDNATQEELNVAVGELESKISVKADNANVVAIEGRVSTLENAGHVNATQLENAVATEKLRAEGIESNLQE